MSLPSCFLQYIECYDPLALLFDGLPSIYVGATQIPELGVLIGLFVARRGCRGPLKQHRIVRSTVEVCEADTSLNPLDNAGGSVSNTILHSMAAFGID